MDYFEIYLQLIEKGKARDFKSKKRKSLGSVETNLYTETHHITPRCIGGDDSNDNLVVLTAREHFLAHKLLCKIYPDNFKINRAFIIMMNKTKGRNCRNYEYHRKMLSIERTGKSMSDETKKKISDRMKIIGKDPQYRKSVSDGVNNAYKTTNLRERVSIATKLVQSRPGFKDKFKKAIKKMWEDPNLRMRASESTKKGNRENPELLQKRLNAIKPHQLKKSDEWKKKCGEWSREYMNRPEVKQRYKEMYSGKNNPVARKVIDIRTKIVYDTAVEASQKLGINLSTIKKWMYKKDEKYNCLWLEDYLERYGNESINL